jgi:hypothetical protein
MEENFMGMFLNYHSIADNYTPNNLIKAFPFKECDKKLLPTEMSKPYEEYDARGELEGYFWRYGDTLNLEFFIDGEVTVEDDSIILRGYNETPTESTIGFIGQRCYNICDFISWTCVAVENKKYFWEKDKVFTYPDTNNTIYVSAKDYLSDKSAKITIYNFRMEPIYVYTVKASTNIIMSITKELSEKLVKGIYYCSLEINNLNMQQTIFFPQDCKILVK